MRTSRLAPLVLAVAAVVTACAEGGDSGDEGAGRQPGTTEQAGTTEPAGAASAERTDGHSAPASELLSVEAPTVGGGTLDLGSLAGEDLALWFWAPW